MGKGRFLAEGLQISPLPLTAARATVGTPPPCGLLSGSKTLRPVVLDTWGFFPQKQVFTGHLLWADAVTAALMHIKWILTHTPFQTTPGRR